jgi:hypothetical protein
MQTEESSVPAAKLTLSWRIGLPLWESNQEFHRLLDLRREATGSRIMLKNIEPWGLRAVPAKGL